MEGLRAFWRVWEGLRAGTVWRVWQRFEVLERLEGLEGLESFGGFAGWQTAALEGLRAGKQL